MKLFFSPSPTAATWEAVFVHEKDLPPLQKKYPTHFIFDETSAVGNKLLENSPYLISQNGQLVIDSDKKLKDAVDQDTKKTIKKGFVFDNNTFSLSPPAQRNWNMIQSAYQTQQFPDILEISTINDALYQLKKSNVSNFIKAAHAAVFSALYRGRRKKNQETSPTKLPQKALPYKSS